MAKNRVASVGFAAFLRGYVAGCKAGKTQSEIAKDLGMNLSSFRTRLVGVRAKVEGEGKKLPDAKRESGTRTVDKTEQVKLMGELLEDLDPAEGEQSGETEQSAESTESGESAPAGEAEASA